MNTELWRRFGADYTANCAAWRHAPDNPVLPASGTTWKSCWTANPDVLEWRGRRLLYYRGNGVLPGTDGKRHDRIAAAEIVSITTARLSREGEWCYMVYGGSAYLADEPDYFGLARSRNLVDWERHPGNPIFGCGAKGTPDGGAMWFPALVQTDDCFVMLYEGSRGKYSWDLSSAICLASIPRI